MNIDPREVRRIILDQCKRAHVGHIGSALSIVEILSVLYDGVLNLPAVDEPDRDRFALSKGHAALALYAVLFLKGFLSKGQLDTFCTDGGELGIHPEHGIPGVDFSTGSLGHGLPMAVGAAVAARLDHSHRRTFALVSDAECNAGSVWEAAMFAALHRLASLIVIVDLNGQQAFGHTRDVLDLSPLADRWRAFRWDVHEVPGHDVTAIAQTIGHLNTEVGVPHVLIAHTCFGKGVSFMERQLGWHYWPLSNDEYRAALAELEAVQ